LVSLVVGVALALSILPWDLDGEPWALGPRWWIVLASVEKAIRTTSLALIPLALWRRARLGGVCRPAELLLVVCAAPGIVDRVDTWLWSEADWNLTEVGYGVAYWLWRGAAWSLCIAAMLGLTLARRKLPDAARSALLMLAVATSFPWLLDPESLNTLPSHYYRAGYAEDTARVITATVTFLVPAVILAAAIRDMILRQSRDCVLEWAGLILAICNVAVALPVHLWGAFLLSSPPWHDLRLHIIYFGGPVLAGTLGSILVWTYAPRCDRWLEPGREGPD
jgi:hypothetical protein